MPHTDQQYIDALLEEDVAMITIIYEKWGAECKRFVIKNSGNAQDADDLFQDSLLTILKQMDRYFTKKKKLSTKNSGGRAIY